MGYSVQAADQVLEYVTGKLKRMEWLPGTRIDTEAKLCGDLGVSRVAVREAIEKLSALSVLRKVQGSGTYVEEIGKVSLMGLRYYPPTKETVLVVLEFRRVFDSGNTELFTRKCSEEDVAALVENYRNMKEAERDPRMFRHYDQQFHDLIADGTRNPIIMQMAEVLRELLSEQQSYLYTTVGPEHAIYYHGIILDAIRNRNAELGARYSRLHIDNALQLLTLPDSDTKPT